MFVAETKPLVKENKLISNWLKITYVVEKMCLLDKTRGALYRGADKSSARQEGNKLMFLSEWSEFPSAPCLAGKKNLMTARVSMLLKSRASLTCFRACFFPGRAKDLSAPW